MSMADDLQRITTANRRVKDDMRPVVYQMRTSAMPRRSELISQLPIYGTSLKRNSWHYHRLYVETCPRSPGHALCSTTLQNFGGLNAVIFVDCSCQRLPRPRGINEHTTSSIDRRWLRR